MARPVLNILDLRRSAIGIFDQLIIEEALLRSDKRNWCIVNNGQAQTAIVMGISGQANKLINVEAAKKSGIPVIRRFTGGGTVVVGPGTLFLSFVCNQGDARGRPLYPKELMRWSAERLYGPALGRLLGGSPSASSQSQPESSPPTPSPSPSLFSLREHDYCLGDRKVGGNAQSVSRERWVHHTSWLWSFSASHMGLLAMPEKRPAYRGDRGHGDFLTTLQQHAPPLPPPAHPGGQLPPGGASAAARGGGDEAADAFLDALVRELGAEWETGAGGGGGGGDAAAAAAAAADSGGSAAASSGPGPGGRVRFATLEETAAAVAANERRSNSYVTLE